MDEIERMLRLYGLNDKETKVYVACLQLGQDTAYNIAEKSGVKRATTYLVLRSLVKKSLVTTHITSKSYLYEAASPTNLISNLEHRKLEIEHALPSLTALYNSVPGKPTIEIFEGLDGMKQVYEAAIAYVKEGNDMIFYGDLSHFKDSPTLLKTWLAETKSAAGNIRELVNRDDFHREYESRVNESQNQRHEVRLLAAETPRFLNDNAVFGDKLVIFSTQKHFFATVITSKEIATSYRVLFDLAWNAAKA